MLADRAALMKLATLLALAFALLPVGASVNAKMAPTYYRAITIKKQPPVTEQTPPPAPAPASSFDGPVGEFRFAQLGTLPFSGGVASTPAGCTTNGSDGFAGAPAGAGQFPTLLSSYVVTPPWCVAGVNFAVGPTPNATASGNTITETGNAVIPVTNDQKTFLAQRGGVLPGGVTAGAQYFLCSVTLVTGSTYSYSLSTTTACGAPVTLTSAGNAFIALKVPLATTNTPANTTGWAGTSATCPFGLFPAVCITGNNVTLDHWDFATGGGWDVSFNAVGKTNPTISNSNFKVGTNGRGFIQDGGENPTNLTIINNILDGNAVPINTTAATTVGSGSSTITVTSAAGLANGMTVCDITNDAAINCANTTNNTYISIVGTTVTLHNASTGGSATTTGTVTAGDVLRFLYFPGIGGTLYRENAISFSDYGSTVAQYNWIRNAVSENWQQSVNPGTGGVSNLGISLKYNIFENAGWGDFTGAHGDGVQIWCGTINGLGSPNCSFQTISLNYNTVIQNNALAPVTTTNFSLLYSGEFGGTAVNVSVQNNTALFSVPGGVTTSTFGLGTVNPSWVTTNVNWSNNYVDPTSACDGNGLNCGAGNWTNISPGNGGGLGSQTPTCTFSGNVNLVNGTTLAKPSGTYSAC